MSAQIDSERFRLLRENEGEFTLLEVNRLDKGKTGEGIVWDFSRAEILSSQNVYISTADSLFALNILRNTYICSLKDNLLNWTGFENRITKLTDSIGSPAIRYPFVYGDSLRGRINLSGHYSTDLQCMETGEIIHRSDACGTLIMPDDTLRNILRVTTVRLTRTLIADTVSTDIMAAVADSLPIVEQTDYRWYSSRYLLPVAFRSDIRLISGDSISEAGSISFISETAYLSHPEPEEDNEDLNTPYRSSRFYNNENTVVTRKGDGSIEIRYGLDSVHDHIEINICDLSGILYHHSEYEQMTPGFHTASIPMTGAPAGQYLLIINKR